jgi:hypothetical protein
MPLVVPRDSASIGDLSPFVTMVAFPAGVRLTWDKTLISRTNPSSILTTEVREIRWQVLKGAFFPHFDPAKIALARSSS